MLVLVLAMSLGSCQGNNNKTKNTAQSKTSKEATRQGYSVGDVATDFSLKNVDGNLVALSDFPDAKGFIVIFTCNHCPYSVAYEDRIIQLNEDFAPQGYPVIAINPNDPEVQPDDSYEKMKERAREKEFKFPYLFDEGQKVYPEYGATRTPHVFVLQREGDQNYVRYIGAIDDNYENAQDVDHHYAADAVKALLSDSPVDPSETKAIGCSIKAQK